MLKIHAARRQSCASQDLLREDWCNDSLKTRFRTSRLYISIIPPLLAGTLVGILSNILGVGGGFIMVPAVTYLLGMPTKVVLVTSFLQIIFVIPNYKALATFGGIIALWRCYWCPSWNSAGHEP